MKKILCFIACVSLNSCIETPDQPELSKETKAEFYKLKKYLGCDRMVQRYSREQTNTYDHLFFLVSLRDVKRDHVNFDSVNNVILSNYQKNGYHLEKCESIRINYMRDYSRAKLRKSYRFNNKFEVVEVSYR